MLVSECANLEVMFEVSDDSLKGQTLLADNARVDGSGGARTQ